MPADWDADAAAAAPAGATEVLAAGSTSCASRPASAAGGSGRTTPRLGWPLDSQGLHRSAGSACWSPGMSEMLDDVVDGLLFATRQAGPQAQTSTAGGINADTEAPEEHPASELAGCSSGVPEVLSDADSEHVGRTHEACARCLVDVETAAPQLPDAAVAAQPTQLAADGAAGVAHQEGTLVQEAAGEGLKPGAELPPAQQVLQPSWAHGQATDACTGANPAYF
ncbi:hypothetical protein ABPG77_007916 [Micractinium sp. CCAP 211/92]